MNLSEAQAAKYLRLSKYQLKKWRDLGKGPPFRKLYGRVHYNTREIEEWIVAVTMDELADGKTAHIGLKEILLGPKRYVRPKLFGGEKGNKLKC